METYHTQPPAKNAKSKLKIEKKTDHPPTISTVPYPLQHSQRRENLYSPAIHSRRVLKLNCTGPALHTAESHTENI
jgi:hypothetical protein